METKKFKIIGRSNFDLDTVNDVLISENWDNEAKAKEIARDMNSEEPEDADYFYTVVPQDYVLKVWKP